MGLLDALLPGLVLTALAGLAHVRSQWKKGKRVLPRVHARIHLSMRSPESKRPSDAPTEYELEPHDVEIIDSSKRAADVDELDTTRPPPPSQRNRRR